MKLLFTYKVWRVITVVAVLLTVSCARIVPLTGGDKDVQPPKELTSVPPNGSVNMKQQKVVITFDEFIRLNNLGSQLIVSPLMDNKPLITANGKKLIVKFDEPLKEETTYNLNFGEAIADITENNAAKGFKYVFSTGDLLDSLSYSGNVAQAYDLAAEENVYVMLYDSFYDSIPLKEPPTYIAVTDKTGNFSITNIAQGTYKVFVLDDINSNYLFDLPNEKIGFCTEVVRIDTSFDGQKLYLFEEDNEKQYVKDVDADTYGKLVITLNRPTADLTITPLNHSFKKSWFISEINEKGDSAIYWLTDTEGIDTLNILVADEEHIIDTVEVSLAQKETFKDSVLMVNVAVQGKLDLNKYLDVTTLRPVKNYTEANIKLYEDSVLVNHKLEAKDKSLRKFSVQYPFQEDKQYQLIMLPNSFEDIYGLVNDTIELRFNTRRQSDYGNIVLRLQPNFDTQYIVQLYKQDRLVKEDFAQGEKILNYNYLLPDDYLLKLVMDNNGDGQWTTGNYLQNQQPERIFIHKSLLTVKAGWENELTWVVTD